MQNYRLIQEVEHRWNSALDMIERLIKMRNGLNSIMADLQKRDHLITPDDLSKMNKLVAVLKYFKGVNYFLNFLLRVQFFPTTKWCEF